MYILINAVCFFTFSNHISKVRIDNNQILREWQKNKRGLEYWRDC